MLLNKRVYKEDKWKKKWKGEWMKGKKKIKEDMEKGKI
jgi:hypothetical protein